MPVSFFVDIVYQVDLSRDAVNPIDFIITCQNDAMKTRFDFSVSGL
jgi:hypothetical protein